MITFHLEAQSMEALRIAACNALDLKMPSAVGMIPTPVDRPGAERLPEPQEEPVQGDKPRRAHRRVRPVEAPVAAPVAAPAPDPDPLEEAFNVLVQPEPAEVDVLDDAEDDNETVPDEPGAGFNAVDNEMLKRTVIASLADMFTAGNVKVVRHVLHKYGRGAKSFPEIDPVHFPEIKAALDRNEAA